MEIYRSIFGRRFKAARERGEMTQIQLAEKLEVESPSVSRWENGHDFPEDWRLPEICKHLKVTTDYFTGAEPRRPSPRHMRQLIEGEELPYFPVSQVLAEFLNASPEIRSSTLAVLYGDQKIAEPYLGKAQGNSKKT